MENEKAVIYSMQWSISIQIGLRNGGNNMKENKMYNQYFKEVSENCVRKYGYKNRGGDDEDEWERDD